MICSLNPALIIFSSISFIGFGGACLGSTRMEREFERYGLAAWRPLLGVLQLSGAAGLMIGLAYPWLGQAAAGGLALMMLAGVIVRIKIKDTVLQMLPAVFYLVLNGYICVAAF